MNFTDAVKNQTRHTLTENGADAYNSTGDKLLDFYGVIGALRDADDARITRLFADAYAEDPIRATKVVFYGRDVRGGLGERKTFRTLINYMAQTHPEAVIRNIPLIGMYGRFDDLYALIDTPLENAMWTYVKIQLEEDEKNMAMNQPVSLLAKWLKTADASSINTRKLGIRTAMSLGMKVPVYKRRIKALRKYIDIVERKMSANQWSEINYSAVPSRASMIYRKAFTKHDEERYKKFIDKAFNGEVKINSSTLYPYDLVSKYLSNMYSYHRDNMDKTIEAQWKQLPNYVEGENNVMIIADTSGSMCGRPLETAVSLAIYFAERNNGPYHNLWMNFSNHPTFQQLKGETLYQKVNTIDYSNWEGSTNLEGAFDVILDLAIQNNLTSDDIPKALVIISDMEINHCLTVGSFDRSSRGYYGFGRPDSSQFLSFYDTMKAKYARYGYVLPNVIFWNVESRHDTFHVDHDRKGVQLASGSAASTFKSVIDAIGMTPVEAMIKTLDSERYAPISLEPKYEKTHKKSF